MAVDFLGVRKALLPKGNFPMYKGQQGMRKNELKYILRKWYNRYSQGRVNLKNISIQSFDRLIKVLAFLKNVPIRLCGWLFEISKDFANQFRRDVNIKTFAFWCRLLALIGLLVGFSSPWFVVTTVNTTGGIHFESITGFALLIYSALLTIGGIFILMLSGIQWLWSLTSNILLLICVGLFNIFMALLAAGLGYFILAFEFSGIIHMVSIVRLMVRDKYENLGVDEEVGNNHRLSALGVMLFIVLLAFLISLSTIFPGSVNLRFEYGIIIVVISFVVGGLPILRSIFGGQAGRTKGLYRGGVLGLLLGGVPLLVGYLFNFWLGSPVWCFLAMWFVEATFLLVVALLIVLNAYLDGKHDSRFYFRKLLPPFLWIGLINGFIGVARWALQLNVPWLGPVEAFITNTILTLDNITSAITGIILVIGFLKGVIKFIGSISLYPLYKADSRGLRDALNQDPDDIQGEMMFIPFAIGLIFLVEIFLVDLPLQSNSNVMIGSTSFNLERIAVLCILPICSVAWGMLGFLFPSRQKA